MDSAEPAQPATLADRVRIALSYPFERPEADTVLAGGRLMNVVRFDADEPLESVVRDPQNGTSGRVGDHLVRQGETLGKTAGFQTILASGSNASPSRIMAKLHTLPAPPLAFFLPGTLADHVAAYSCHFASYGSIPATLTRYQGATVRLVALVLPTVTLEMMHESESLGRNYGYYRLSESAFQTESGQSLWQPQAYLSLRGLFAPNGQVLRMAAVEAQACNWPAPDQEQALSVAAGMLGATGIASDFLRTMLVDDELRESRSSRLGQIARQPLDTDGWARLD